MPFIGVMFFGYRDDFIYAIWNVIADMLVTVFQGFFCKVVDSFITDCAGTHSSFKSSSAFVIHCCICCILFSRSGLDD